ncbi:serine threonine-protein kinase [Phaffia rhodozyma]|uniref:non-specific serine/threonine protein kinase n=1 Tax=Phaffia rhodozyma TaxID=264483 RepID=A0A0F7SHV8_PHARH|nr:serine threonine-protein kinase [Phaffia rhodozyma]
MTSVIITPVTPVKQKMGRPGTAALAIDLTDIPSPSPPRRQAVNGPASARPTSSLGRRPPATRFEKEMARDGGLDPEGDKNPKFMGPWRFGKIIGRGAAGRVRFARHAQTQRPAAIKILPKQLLRDASVSRMSAMDRTDEKLKKYIQGIEREITILKLVDHPNIMRLLDVFEDDKYLYLVLEFVQGGELFDYLVQRRYLQPPEALRYFQQIIRGVDYCHHFNICHRDLKPENLLLDQNMNIKIADFGMAVLQPVGEWLDTSCGSPHYASPEIVAGKKYHGGASDIWSCGVILFALLTGRLPFDDANIGILLQKVKAGRFEIPSGVPRSARDLIEKMLVVDPKKRIKMSEIFAHPFFNSKVDYSIGKRIRIVEPPSFDEISKPVSSKQDIDPEILKNLKVLWHSGHDDFLTNALLSDEKNIEKAFYTLLVRYKNKRLENLGSSDGEDDLEEPVQVVRNRSTSSRKKERSSRDRKASGQRPVLGSSNAANVPIVTAKDSTSPKNVKSIAAEAFAEPAKPHVRDRSLTVSVAPSAPPVPSKSACDDRIDLRIEELDSTESHDSTFDYDASTPILTAKPPTDQKRARTIIPGPRPLSVASPSIEKNPFKLNSVFNDNSESDCATSESAVGSTVDVDQTMSKMAHVMHGLGLGLPNGTGLATPSVEVPPDTPASFDGSDSGQMLPPHLVQWMQTVNRRLGLIQWTPDSNENSPNIPTVEMLASATDASPLLEATPRPAIMSRPKSDYGYHRSPSVKKQVRISVSGDHSPTKPNFSPGSKNSAGLLSPASTFSKEPSPLIIPTASRRQQGWFSNLFHWKGATAMLICPQDEMSTRADCDKAFKAMGVSVATQAIDGLYVLRVFVNEIEDIDGQLLRKPVKLRVEFRPHALFQSPNPESAGTLTSITLVQEKGALSSFEVVCGRLRNEWPGPGIRTPGNLAPSKFPSPQASPAPEFTGLVASPFFV